jgi:hypothetical protein
MSQLTDLTLIRAITVEGEGLWRQDTLPVELDPRRPQFVDTSQRAEISGSACYQPV